jgi:hypothetical protein
MPTTKMNDDEFLEYHIKNNIAYIDYIQSKGRGHGSILIDALKVNNDHAVAEVHKHNLVGKRFFEKNGFIPNKETQKFITYVWRSK